MIIIGVIIFLLVCLILFLVMVVMGILVTPEFKLGEEKVVNTTDGSDCDHEWAFERVLNNEFVIDETPTAYKVTDARKYTCVRCECVRFVTEDAARSKWILKKQIPSYARLEMQK